VTSYETAINLYEKCLESVALLNRSNIEKNIAQMSSLLGKEYLSRGDELNALKCSQKSIKFMNDWAPLHQEILSTNKK
jgi:hypothetical protein